MLLPRSVRKSQDATCNYIAKCLLQIQTLATTWSDYWPKQLLIIIFSWFLTTPICNLTNYRLSPFADAADPPLGEPPKQPPATMPRVDVENLSPLGSDGTVVMNQVLKHDQQPSSGCSSWLIRLWIIRLLWWTVVVNYWWLISGAVVVDWPLLLMNQYCRSALLSVLVD